MKLAVNLLTFNGGKYLPFLFDSLRAQTMVDWHLYILDNGSTDDTRSRIEELTRDQFFSKRVSVEMGDQNIGFAAGHNRLVGRSDSEYFLVLNQDVFLQADCLARMIAYLDANKNIWLASPRLMRWDFDRQQPTNVVDSLGLRVHRSRRVTDIDQGKTFDGDESARVVFGVSGAVAFGRRSSLSRIGYLFDDKFFAYKEDVDLSYRVNLAGGQCVVVKGAVAYHDRTVSGVGDDLHSALRKSSQNAIARRYSYRNHLLTLWKNEFWQNLALDFPWILWYECKKLAYYLLFDRSALRGVWAAWRQAKRTRAVIGWRQMRARMYG